MLKILHTADWHLNDRDIEECERCVTALEMQAGSLMPDLIVHAGDMFHRYDVKLDSKAARLAFKSVRTLSKIAPMVILQGTYSHEGNASELFNYLKGMDDRIYVSQPEVPETVYLNDDTVSCLYTHKELVRAAISLVPPLTHRWLKSLAEEAPEDLEDRAGNMLAQYLLNMGAHAQEFNCPHVLVGHWTVGGCNISDTQVMIGRDIELSQEQIGMVGADLVCLGHIHMAQKIGSNIFYSGSLYRRTFGELDDKGFWLHLLDDSGAVGHVTLRDSIWYDLPATKRIVHKFDYTEKGVPVTFSLNLGNEIQDAVVRLEITFDQADEYLIDFDALRNIYLSHNAQEVDIVKIRIPDVAVRSQRVLKARTFTDKFEAWADTKGQEVNDFMGAAVRELESMPPEKVIDSVRNQYQMIREEA